MLNGNKVPPLRLLRAFCITARHLSFKVAADRLALTPSAISHQVRELEDLLGVTLFQRRTRAITLTPAGQKFLAELEPVLEALGAVVARTLRNAPPRNQLHVVMPPFFASEVFAPALQGFQARHPDIDIHVDTLDARPDQHQASTDVSILLLSRPPEGDVEAVRLAPLRLVATCSPELAKTLQGRGLEAVKDCTIILHRHRPWSWDRWVEAMGSKSMPARKVVEFDSMHLVASAAANGVGVTLIPADISERWFQLGALTPLPGTEFDTGEAYYLVVRRDDMQRPEVSALREWAIEQFQRV
jgi:LysR family glycine cleavage system transcriptional activator